MAGSLRGGKGVSCLPVMGRRLPLLLAVMTLVHGCSRTGYVRRVTLEGDACRAVKKEMRITSEANRTVGQVRRVSKALIGDRCTAEFVLSSDPAWPELTEKNCDILEDARLIMLRYSTIGYASPDLMEGGRPGCRLVSYKIGRRTEKRQ